jgi:hypothetical protein
MLVKMGLEEETINEKTGTRRRRQKAARRQASPHHQNAVMGDWSNGLGLYHGHAHHVAAGAAARAQGQPYDAMMGGAGAGGDDHFGGPPHLTPKQEEDLINDVFRDVKMERSLSPDDSTMDGLSYGNSNGVSRRPSTGASSLSTREQHLNHQGSARVARQACDQLLQHPPSHTIPEHPYGAQ